jgi:uncharacterized protein (UPF0261 family)
MPLYDPEADKAFVHELRVHLSPKIPIIEIDLQLNTHEFAEEAVKHFIKLYKANKSL